MRDTIIAEPCGISNEDMAKVGEIVLQLTQPPPKPPKEKKNKKDKSKKNKKSK